MTLKFEQEFEMVTRDGLLLKDLGIARKDNRVVTAAVRQNGLALRFASPELRADEGIVVTAVSKNGMALKYAAKEFRSDRAMVLEAVQSASESLQYANEVLRSEKGMVIAAVIGSGKAIKFASDMLKNDVNVMWRAVRTFPAALRLASDANRSDRKFVRPVVATNGRALRYASEELRRDKKLRELARDSMRRFKARRLRPEESKALFVKALNKGYVTHGDIRQAMPSYVISAHELLEIQELLEKDFDVFKEEPSQQERDAGLMAVRNRAFQEFLRLPITTSDKQ